MRFRRRNIPVTIILAFVLGMCALPAHGQSPAPLTIHVGATANDTYAQAYYAQDLGFFKKAGLNVELSTFTNGAAVSAAVASGALDLGVSNPVGIANAVAHGVHFVYIAGGGLYDTKAPTTVLCVAKNSPLKSPKELEGKTVAVSALKDISALGVQAWLANEGVDVAKVRFTEIAFSQMGPALERGTVAAAMISEPSLTAARSETRVLGKAFDAIGKHFLISGWFTTSDWAMKNPDAAKRFVSVMYESARWANAHRDQSAAILSKYSKIDADTARKMERCMYATSLSPQLLVPSVELATKFNVLEHTVPASELIAKGF